MKWRKILYEIQNYKRNYMNINVKENFNFSKIKIVNILGFSSLISCTFIFFQIFLSIKNYKICDYFEYILILQFLLFFKISENSLKFYKSASLIILILYFISPYFKYFTKNISDDTIYFFYFLLSFIYAFDIMRCNILNNRIIIEYDGPISIQHSILLPRNYNYIPTIGYISNINSAIMLSSRFESNQNVYIIIIYDIIFFFILPVYLIPISFRKFISILLITLIYTFKNKYLFNCYCLIQIVWLILSLGVNILLRFYQRQYL